MTLGKERAVIDQLLLAPSGRIFLAQLWQGLQEQGTPAEMLSGFIETIETSTLKYDVHSDVNVVLSFVQPYIWSNVEQYRFLNRRTIDLECDISTVMSLGKLLDLLEDDRRAELECSPMIGRRVRKLSSRDLKRGARIGFKPPLTSLGRGQIDTLWATDSASIDHIVATAYRRGEGNHLEASLLRNQLGLVHLRDIPMILVRFKTGALSRHLNSVPQRACKEEACHPFTFDGIDNPRFSLSSQKDNRNWNYCMNLGYFANNSEPPNGLPEIITTSIDSSEVYDFLYFPTPGKTPCEGKEDEVARLIGRGRDAESLAKELSS